MSLKDLFITEQRLGESGFGSVFVCKLGNIKVAAKELSQSESEFKDLAKEALRLKKLQYGKHIVYIYGITLKEESLYIVIEYCRFGDLKSFLNRNAGSITYDKKILFCRGILLGLLYCHSMEIFHGDIKCSNVILGKDLEPKLTDFGLGMTVDNTAYYSKLYKKSLYWTAPELLSIKEDKTLYRKLIADPYPCDTYSLGATFCEISYDGTTEFIGSDDPAQDVMIGILLPMPRDAFLKEIINGCCKFKRKERISLDECLTALDAIAETQLPIPVIDNKWQEIQQDIKASSKLELPPSFILRRPVENFVVGPSNLSLLEWLCINNCVDAVKYMIQLHKYDQNQIKWLCAISELCKSAEVADFLKSHMQDSEISHLRLFKLIDKCPQESIRMLIKAGASRFSYSLLKKAIEKFHNMTVQAIVDSKSHFKNWAIYDAIKFGNIEAVKILVNAGTNLEWKDYYTGNTPLKIAIDTENIEIVEILLEFGVDAHSESDSTRSGMNAEIPHRPLYLAALKDNREIVKLLIDAGATIDIKSNEWSSLSQNLEQQENVSMARFILNSISKKSSSVENNSLCAAIQDKQPDLAQTLIDSKVNIDEIGLDGYAPLHWAVIVGDEEAVRILIKAGVDLDIRASNRKQDSLSIPAYLNKYTPLHIAVAKKYWRLARFLVESGADFSAKNGLQQTVVDIAQENRKVLEKILWECAPINAISIRRVVKSMGYESIKIMIKNRQINSEILSEYLCIAASSGKSDLVKHLLEYLLINELNINKRYQGKTPLEWAIFGSNIQTIKVLIDAGAHINVENSYQETSLFRCVWESQVDAVKLLVDKGADVNVRNSLGYKPIRYAKGREVTEILIKAGTAIDVKSDDGIRLLIGYISESQVEMVQFLIKNGIDVNARDENGNAPVHHVDNREIMEILINAGADVNAEDKYGETPLIQSVEKSNAEIVQLLVDKGVDVNTKDRYKKTPIHYTNDRKIMGILIDAGADINTKDQYGRTFLIQSVIQSNVEMVQFLVNKGADVNMSDNSKDAPIDYTKSKEIRRILINAGADVNIKDKHEEEL